MTIAYGVCFIISMFVIIFMARQNYENVSIQYWSIIILIPIIEAAYFLRTLADSPDAAYALQCFIYIDGTFLVTLFLFLLVRIIKVDVEPWMKVAAYGIAFINILMVVLCFDTKHFYNEIKVIQNGNGNIVKMTDGTLMTVHYEFLIGIFTAIITVIIIGFLKKGTYSLRVLTINTTIVVLAIGIYIVENLVDADYSVLPFLYMITELIFAFGYNYSREHELSSVIAKQQSSDEAKGYMALAMNGRFLGCNEKCKEFVPSLKTQRIDERLPEGSELRGGIEHFIEAFEKGERSTARFTVGDRIWICDISYFSIRKDGRNHGYLFELRDATEEERTYSILQSYNETLNSEVKEKTENIKQIQRNILSGMANMIENRDSNTGGHVKRTSDVVKILIDEINNEGHIQIEEKLANEIISSAPMHDLGKITIDSYILCKPGRLTDEEFEIMKTHSTKSGEIVKILLEGVEEPSFVETCYNVARYHHEKWDGTGYPEGLKGDAIPFGARVMAVADVYDALVSKRCYKESMSFQQAESIMLDGMGKMFDPALEPVFLGCKEKLEEYYSLLR